MTPDQPTGASPWYLWLARRYGDEIASRIIKETATQARAELIEELKPVAYRLHTGHGTALRDTIPECEMPEAWKALAIIPDKEPTK